jgi:hypothetical protein
VEGTAIDFADNQVSTTVTVNIDQTAPMILAEVTPLANAQGWHKQDVTISFHADDVLSGIDSLTGPVVLTQEGVGQKVIGTAIDRAGNSSQVEVELNIDKTLPQINASIQPAANANGWHNRDVLVEFTAQDSLSGIDNVTGAVNVTTEGSGQSVTGEAKDLAGNSNQVTALVNLDKTNPQLNITSPEQNKQYQLNNPIAITYLAEDSLSGIDITAVKLDGIDISGQKEITPASGQHNLEVITTDKADNPARATVNFSVTAGQEKILADVTIKPEVFVFNQGAFLALVKLPAQYNVSDIVQASCDGAQARLIMPIPQLKTAVMIFRRQDITVLPIDTTFVINGKLKNGQEFEGTDTIRKVLNKGRFINLWEKLKAGKEETDALEQSLNLVVHDRTKKELIKQKMRE